MKRLAIVFVFLVLTGCGSADGPNSARKMGEPVNVRHPATPSDVDLLTPYSLDVDDDNPTLTVVELELSEGIVECQIRSERGGTLQARRITRIGPNLVILPLGRGGARHAQLAFVQPANSGPLSANLQSVSISSVTEKTAARVADSICNEFESRTMVRANPVDDNLIPNADFKSDDEVRGTPADWFAYVETQSNQLDRSLLVSGVPPPNRPFLASAPIRVNGRQFFRLSGRILVRDGMVRVRVMDYDELETVFDSDTVFDPGESRDFSWDFTVPAGTKAVRVWFSPQNSGERAEFVVSEVNLQDLVVAQSS